MLNANGEPRGILHEYHVKEMIYHPFGRDLLKNRIYQRRISHFVTPAPIADLDTPADEMLKIFAGMDGSDCVILTENMRYAGILSASSLLKIINEKQLKMAQEQNPLTGLPGNRAIRDYVQHAILDGDEARYFCYCDFDDFKPFNDTYGFQKGDLAITLFAALLRRHFIGEEKFLGHVGGDDFFVGVSGFTEEEIRAVLMRLVDDFRLDVRQLYTPEHQAAGGISGHGRDGLARTSADALLDRRAQASGRIHPVRQPDGEQADRGDKGACQGKRRRARAGTAWPGLSGRRAGCRYRRSSAFEDAAMTLPTEMIYVDLPAPGGPENMVLARGPLPQVKPGDVLVRVEAFGVNRPDLLQRRATIRCRPARARSLGSKLQAKSPLSERARPASRLATRSVRWPMAEPMPNIAPCLRHRCLPGPKAMMR